MVLKVTSTPGKVDGSTLVVLKQVREAKSKQTQTSGTVHACQVVCNNVKYLFLFFCKVQEEVTA